MATDTHQVAWTAATAIAVVIAVVFAWTAASGVQARP